MLQSGTVTWTGTGQHHSCINISFSNTQPYTDETFGTVVAKEYNYIAAKTVKKKVSERKTAVFNLLFTVDYFMYRPVICPCMI